MVPKGKRASHSWARRHTVGASIDTIVIKETVASIEVTPFATREECLLTYRKKSLKMVDMTRHSQESGPPSESS
jgi:hypothetical protein